MKGPEISAAPAAIQVPVLKNKVIIDGKISTITEWSDASRTNLTLLCAELCELAKVDTAGLTLQTKHDEKWFYFLYRVDWPKELGRKADDSVQIRYYWSPPTPWEHQDVAAVRLDSGNDYWGSYNADGTFVQYTDTELGGQNNVEGMGSNDAKYYWFEFRKELTSDDGFDWTLVAGKNYGNPLRDGLLEVHFKFGEGDYMTRFKQNIMISLCPCTEATTATTSVTATTQSTSIATTTSTAQPALTTTTALAVQMPFASLEVVGLGVLAVVGIVSTFLVIRGRKTTRSAAALEQIQVPEAAYFRKAAPPSQITISTGYSDLDKTLEGGIPEGYAVAIVSPSYDERDLLIRRIIEKSIASNRPAFYVSNDLSRTKELVARYRERFYAFSSEADRVTVQSPNLFKIPGIENLSEANISLTLAMREARSKEAAKKMIIVLDILSDVLLQHKAITTRKWLSDFVAKRKAEGFTVIATFSPVTATKEETQIVVDLFDGVIEIYERDLKETARRFLLVKKMYGHRYSQAEILLDFDKLWKEHN